MGCGGQIPLLQILSKRAAALIYQYGGICIADEIQIGFGRIGKNFWGLNITA